jgi:hypothetical protein
MSTVKAQIRATIQPITVYPNNRFIIRMATRFLLCFMAATIVGVKYSAVRKITESATSILAHCLPVSSNQLEN